MAILSKIVLIGDGAVGKTSLRQRFMGDTFTGKYMMTVGADFSLKTIKVDLDGKVYDIKFQLWDLAGQQRFKEVRGAFYTGSQGCLLVYDITRPDTFDNTISWLMELGNNAKDLRGNPPPVILLGNKMDLKHEVDYYVPTDKGEALAGTLPEYYCNNRFTVPFYETSAATGQNVDEAFAELARMIIRMNKKD